MDLEGTERMLVVGSHKDDRHFVADQFEDLEAVELRHMNVEEEQVGLELRNHLDGFKSIGALAHDFNFGMALQQFAQELAGKFFVLDDYGAGFVFCFLRRHGCAVLLSAGSRMFTRKWSPSLRASKVARLP